jgi:hypothetical protein
MATEQRKKGVVWLVINSGAPGRQGHGHDLNARYRGEYGMGDPILLDENGDVGRIYGAEKTPHLFIVDGQGKLVYRGGLDNAPMGEVDGGGDYQAYVRDALADLVAGRPVRRAETPPYGCTVKYYRS